MICDWHLSSSETYTAIYFCNFGHIISCSTIQQTLCFLFIDSFPLLEKKYSSDHIVSLCVEPIQDSLGVPLDLILRRPGNDPNSFPAYLINHCKSPVLHYYRGDFSCQLFPGYLISFPKVCKNLNHDFNAYLVCNRCVYINVGLWRAYTYYH